MAKGAIITEKVFSSIMILHEANPELNSTQIGKVFKVDASTVGKMIRCGTWEKYEEFKKEKAEKGRQREAARRKAEEQKPEPQIEGQIRMELLPEEKDPVPEMVRIETIDPVKLMRFQAEMTSRICEKITAQSLILNETLLVKLDRLNDTMSMVLRAVRRE